MNSTDTHGGVSSADLYARKKKLVDLAAEATKARINQRYEGKELDYALAYVAYVEGGSRGPAPPARLASAVEIRTDVVLMLKVW